MHFLRVFLFSCFFNISVLGSVYSSSENTGYFWHVTDIHVDQNYSRSGNPNNLCHSEKTLFSDNGLYGNFLCDSPQYLVNVTFQAMNKIKPNPDFIVWTGDNLPHTQAFDPDWNVIYEALYNVTYLLKQNFPSVPVYPCIGNHDTFPPNVLLANVSSKSVYQGILDKGGWNNFLNKDTYSTFITGGYYSQVIRPGLRIVSLNTILWYAPNNFTEKMRDPAHQFKWLEEVLRNCSKSLEKVYIIGHVPPGFYNRVRQGEKSFPTYHPQYLKEYLEILKKYSKIIKCQLFGHLHMDMFQLFQLGSGYFVSSSLLASSVTPWHSKSEENVSIPVNPSIRLMHYDRIDGLLKDYDQFYFNLTKANIKNKTQESYYELLYTFTGSYNVPDVSTESLVAVFEKIKTNSTLFNTFFKFSTAGKESVACDAYCKVAQLCSISSTSIDEYNNCMPCNSSSSFIYHYTIHHDYSKYFTYGIAIVISFITLFLLCFMCRKYKRSDNEIYSKLLKDF